MPYNKVTITIINAGIITTIMSLVLVGSRTTMNIQGVCHNIIILIILREMVTIFTIIVIKMLLKRGTLHLAKISGAIVIRARIVDSIIIVINPHHGRVIIGIPA